jgi:hypothetical protein
MNNFDNVYANFLREEKQKQMEREREEKKRETERAIQNGELIRKNAYQLYCEKCENTDFTIVTRSCRDEDRDYTFSQTPPILCNHCSMPFLPIQFTMLVETGKKRDNSNMYMLSARPANR